MGAGGFCFVLFFGGEKKQWRNLLFCVWGLFFSVSDFLHCVLRACVFLSVDFFVCLFVRVVVFAFAGFVVWETLTIYITIKPTFRRRLVMYLFVEVDLLKT